MFLSVCGREELASQSSGRLLIAWRRSASNSIHAHVAPRPCDQRQQCPWQAESENESEVSPGAGVADGARPAQLMLPELAQRVGGEKCCDSRGAEFDSLAGRGDPTAEFVVVGQVVEQRFEAADGGEIGAAEGQRRAQSEVQSVFEESCAQNSGHEVGGDAEGLEARAEGMGGLGAIEAGDQADLRVGERSDDLLQIIGGDADVAVVYEQNFVTCLRVASARDC